MLACCSLSFLSWQSPGYLRSRRPATKLTATSLVVAASLAIVASVRPFAASATARPHAMPWPSVANSPPLAVPSVRSTSAARSLGTRPKWILNGQAMLMRFGPLLAFVGPWRTSVGPAARMAVRLSAGQGASSARGLRVGYYESWTNTRPCDGLPVDHIQPHLYTHLNYAFALIDGSSLWILFSDLADEILRRRSISEVLVFDVH